MNDSGSKGRYSVCSSGPIQCLPKSVALMLIPDSSMSLVKEYGKSISGDS